MTCFTKGHVTTTSAPGPHRRYPGEFAVAMARDSLNFLTRVAREHGDVAHWRIATERLFLLSHPDFVRDVLVTHHKSFKKGRTMEHARMLLGDGLLTSEGELHLRQRRMMQPAFHRRRVAAYGETMAECARHRSDGWRHGDRFDVHEEMVAITLSIVGRTLFDADVESEARDIGEAVSATLDAFNATFFMPWGRLLARVPLLPATRRFRAARARLEATIFRIITERRERDVDRGDLLSMLLAARDDEGDGTGMSDRQIRDEVLTLILAGHETTANALTWAWCLLAQHPGVERRLHEELDALGDAPPGADDLARLPYTRSVFDEVLRLYPPSWAMGRRALEEYHVGGYLIPAGSMVLVSQWITHRDPRWWPDPERFDPDRFLPERVAARPKFSYFPFGGGPRVCIGEPFARLEGALVLATIAQRWRFRLMPDQLIEAQATITLRPKTGVRVVAERR